MWTYHLFAVNPSGAVEVWDGDSTHGSRRAALRDAAGLAARWRQEYGSVITGSAVAGYQFDDGAALHVGRCRDADCIECADWRRSVGLE